jgi:lipopolysaccharide transport system ATP-binding protein
MTRPEIRRQFDAIVDFAEVETFLDTPVKRYSSGMYVRLAFAVAAHLNPEILIVDEVLAVGDAEFQKKCLGKMGDVAAGGRTVLFVSHNMVALRALCPGSIVLSKGQVVFSGRTSDAIRHSVNFGQHTSHPIVSHFRKITPHLDVVSARVNGSEVDTVDLASNDRVLTVDLVCRAHSPVLVELEARVVDEQGTPLAYFNPGYRDGRSHSGSGLFRICSTIQLPSIAKGRYLLDLRVTHPGIAVWADAPRAVRLNAEGSPTATGMTMDYRDFAFTLLDGNSRISAGLPEN